MIRWGSEPEEVNGCAPLPMLRFTRTFTRDGQPIIRWELEPTKVSRKRVQAPVPRQWYARVHRRSYKLDDALYALSKGIIEDRYQWVGWVVVGLVGVILVVYMVVAAVCWGWPGC